MRCGLVAYTTLPTRKSFLSCGVSVSRLSSPPVRASCTERPVSSATAKRSPSSGSASDTSFGSANGPPMIASAVAATCFTSFGFCQTQRPSSHASPFQQPPAHEPRGACTRAPLGRAALKKRSGAR